MPALLGTGGASEPFYAPIAAAVAERVPGSRVQDLPGLRHFAPIVTPGPFAGLVLPFLAGLAMLEPTPPAEELAR